MALADLLRRLEEDAASRADVLLSTARAEADRLAAEGVATLVERRARRMASRETELRAAAARNAAAARQESATRFLVARDEAVGRVLARVASLLRERRETAPVLERAAADLASALGYLDGGGSVRCRPELADWVRARLPGKTAFAVHADPSAGTGAILGAADGSVEIDATVEQRLARLRPELTVEAARLLARGNGAGLG